MANAKLFSEQELQKIEAAVKASEVGTSGEIVPVFVNQAGSYPEAPLRSAMLGTGLFMLVFLLWDLFVPSWGLYDPLWITLFIAGGTLLGWLLGRLLPGWQRYLIGPSALAEQAFVRADQWFLKEEIFKTRDRTGIMIFIARYEHQVIIRADKGIAKIVDHGEWQHIADDLVAAIKRQDLTGGIITAINACAELLRARGVEARPDDADELSNRLRME